MEDLGLTFTLPGANSIELKPGGSPLPLTSSNIQEYLDLVLLGTFYTSVSPQVAAFKAGFNQVCFDRE